MARFSDVFFDATKEGCKIPKEKYLPQGLYPIIDQGQGDIAGYTNNSDGLYKEVPAVIFGDHTRIIKYVDTPFFLGADGVKLLKAKDPAANYKYLFYALCAAKIPDTGYNRHFKWLKELDIPLPSPDEQRRIVSILDKVTSLIALRKQQLAKLDELVKARFVEMFGNENEFSKWPQCTVADVAEVCVGVVIKPVQYYTDHGIPAFRSLNIGEMHIKNSDWVYFTQDGHEKNSKSIVRENDVLVVRSGAPGTACVVDKKFAGYNAVDIIIAHPNQSQIDPVFLAMFTNMPHGMRQIKVKIGGAAQQHFNVGEYKSLKLILPPYDLQHKFLHFYTKVEISRLTISQSLDTLEALKKSLMQIFLG